MSEIYDVVFVGCGFGSVCTLAKFQKLGLKCHIYERNARSGGVWSENAYPGARVDSDAPLYQMFDKEMWSGFDFEEKYPGRHELCRYFDYIDSKLRFSDCTTYNANVTGARWSEKEGLWTVKAADKTTKCRWFIPAIGFAAKGYIPKIPGMETFKGDIHHSAYWPEGGVKLDNKRVAVIGTGASGVQIIQAVGPIASKLVVYQRTPNLCLPMKQKPIAADVNESEKADGTFDSAFAITKSTFAGFNFDFQKRNCFDDTPEQREAFFESLLAEGGFKYWLNTYADIYKDPKANAEAYTFWRKSVIKRLEAAGVDKRKQELLAPEIPPHPFGCKRPSLEQKYYETYGLPNVDLVDISADPIREVTATGMVTESGRTEEFDVIALATGFDAVTGSLAQLDIRNDKGESISDHWKGGLRTSCGVALHGFPNMFFLYGPQAPTAFSNGPSTVQVQAKFMDDIMRMIIDRKLTRVEPTAEAENYWTKETHKYWDDSLFPMAKSWYNGANIPGKRVEPLNYIGGMPKYIEELADSLDNDMQRWIVA